MQVDIALCQIRPMTGSPEMNAETVANMLVSRDEEVLIFPESFLTGYGVSPEGLEERISAALTTISDTCRKYDKAVAVGTPMPSPEGWTNSLAFLSPDGDSYYDKIHLARFGVYAEDGYVAGRKPSMGSYHGIRFGFSICYDIYFPEVLHGCSLRRADVNICISAAATPSAPYFETILPARALENVTYLAFVNNVGPANSLVMAGTSRAVDPLGREIVRCPADTEAVETFTFDTEVLAKARSTRRHLQDFRSDIDWFRQSF